MKVALELRRRAEEEGRKALGGRNSKSTCAPCKSLHGRQTGTTAETGPGARREQGKKLGCIFAELSLKARRSP